MSWNGDSDENDENKSSFRFNRPFPLVRSSETSLTPRTGTPIFTLSVSLHSICT